MRRSNGGVIWLLIAGAGLAFAFNQVTAYILQMKFFIPSFIVLVLSGYINARVIGRVGGEFSIEAKGYSILLEGFMFGLAFDLLRMRYDFVINIFKHIAIGAFFILIAMVFKSNLEKYLEAHPRNEPHLGIMRPPFLYIFAGISFGFAVNSIAEAFLQHWYFIALLPFLLGLCIFVMITAKADYDLLEAKSGAWQQLFAGGAFGVTIDLLLFRILLWQDLINVFCVFIIFIITAMVIRMKGATELKPSGEKIELQAKKSKKKIVGTIELEKRPPTSPQTYTRTKVQRSSKYKKTSKKES